MCQTDVFGDGFEIGGSPFSGWDRVTDHISLRMHTVTCGRSAPFILFFNRQPPQPASVTYTVLSCVSLYLTSQRTDFCLTSETLRSFDLD